MNTGINYTSVKNNFIKGHLAVEDFIDEKTWDSLSEGAKMAVYELSNELVNYIELAITQAVENDPNFLHEFRELTLKVLKQENHENEAMDKKQENINIVFP